MQWEIIAGATKRGKEQLTNNYGYTYTFQSSSKDGQSRYWMCTRRASHKCKARVIQRGEEFTPAPTEHVCEAQAGAVMIAKVKATTNREALKRPHESAQAIANEVKFLEQYEF